MASSTVKKDDADHDQWQAAQTGHDQFEWHQSNFHQNPSSSTEPNTDADLLHNRLNAQLSTDETTKKTKPEDPYFIDEELLIEREALLSEEDKEKRHKESQASKDEGNDSFGRGEYQQALEKYSNAISLCPMKHTRDRAVIYANRAACLMKMEKYEAAVQSCTKSIELDPTYTKPYIRRADSYKQIDKLEEALQDYQKILELDPNNAQARREVYVLPDQIKERNEKLKEEM
ncbi:unnamed protein product [Adineta ricciae]|nr:unnamed protein product [Adineta ricciae]